MKLTVFEPTETTASLEEWFEFQQSQWYDKTLHNVEEVEFRIMQKRIISRLTLSSLGMHDMDGTCGRLDIGLSYDRKKFEKAREDIDKYFADLPRIRKRLHKVAERNEHCKRLNDTAESNRADLSAAAIRKIIGSGLFSDNYWVLESFNLSTDRLKTVECEPGTHLKEKVMHLVPYRKRNDEIYYFSEYKRDREAYGITKEIIDRQ